MDLISTGAITKGKSIAVYLGISAPVVELFNVLGLDIDYMLIWASLMILDSILGWIIAIMNSEFSSRTAQNRLARKCALIIMLAGVAFVGTIYPHIQSLSSWVMFSFMLSELISIVRHGYTINTGEKLPEADIVKIITKQLFGQLSKFLPKETKKK